MKKLVALVALVRRRRRRLRAVASRRRPAFADRARPTCSRSTRRRPRRRQKAVAKVKITPGAGYHMNKEYPDQASLTAPAGVTVAKTKLTPRTPPKLEEAGGEFDVAYTARRGGQEDRHRRAQVRGVQRDTCHPKKRSVSFTVDVK